MAQVTITKTAGERKSLVIMNPSIDGNKKMTVLHSNVDRVRLLDIPEALDMVNIHMVSGEVIELHFSVGVEIDGTTATSNDNLLDLIHNHLEGK